MHLKINMITAVIYIAAMSILLCPRPGAASPIPDATATSTAAFCPPNMAFIPAGEFLVGWDNGEPDERPEKLSFTPSYCIDKFEYPNENGAMPMDNISYNDAAKICESQGKRMCGEVEWERACRGPKGIIYTDSQDYVAGDCNLNSSGPVPTGSFEKCVNGYGVHDMTGNLWEWAEGVYAADTPWPIIKGGAYLKGPLFASCYARFTSPPDAGEAGTGFRCCSAPLPESGINTRKENSCTSRRLQYTVRKDILGLLRDPGITNILYIDFVNKHKKTTEAESKAVVLRKESAQAIETVINGDKTDTKTKDVPLDAAAALVEDFKTAISQSAGENHVPSACWSCDQTCIFFDGKWYDDTAGFKEKMESSAIFNTQ